MNGRAWTSRAAQRTRSSSIASSPSRMLAPTVPEKRKTSWSTMATLRRSAREVPLAHVDAVDPHRAAVDVVEAQQQVGERALAGAGVADHGQRLARPHPEGDPLEHRLAFLVGEPDVARTRSRPRTARGPVGRAGRGDGHRRVEQRKIRSELAMAACRMLYFSERSESGW